MIEQLYYTWSTTGLGSVTGFRVRAVSQGLSDLQSERYQAIVHRLRYDLPVGMDAYEATTDNSPRSLTLLYVKGEPLLLHKVYVGKDSYGRPGVPSIHLLASLPPGFLAHDAIQLWASRFWILAESQLSNDSKTLPQISSVAELGRGPLNEKSLQSLESELTYAVQAYFSLEPSQHLFIAAHSEQVGSLIWGLTACLPRTMQQSLSFSTYERDLYDVKDRVVGTCWLPEDSTDLPALCYGAQGLAINCFSGRRSPLTKDTAKANYASFVVHCLLHGEKKRLDTLLSIAENMNIQQVDDLLVVFRLFVNGDLSKDDILQLLQSPVLAAGLLTQENIQISFLRRVNEDIKWWNDHAQKALETLQKQPALAGELSIETALLALAKAAAADTAKALARNDERAAIVALNVLHAVAPPSIYSAPWLHLLEIASPLTQDSVQVTSWKLREWLLKQWLEMKLKIEVALIHPWLEVTWDEFSLLLQLPLPSTWEIQATIDLLMAERNVHLPTALPLIQKNHVLFEKALKHILLDEQTQSVALKFITKLIKAGYKYKVGMFSSLLTARIQDPLIHELMRVLDVNEQEKASIFEQRYQELATSIFFPDFVEAYLNDLSLELLSNPTTLICLEFIRPHAERLSGKTQRNFNDWFLLCYSVEQKSSTRRLDFSPSYLQSLSDTIRRRKISSKAYQTQLIDCIVTSVGNLDQLHSAITNLAPSLEKDPYAFFLDITTHLGKTYKSSLTPPVLALYILLACEYTAEGQKNAKKQLLLPVLDTLLPGISRQTLNQLDKKTADWSEHTKVLWQENSSAFRSKTLLERLTPTFMQSNTQPQKQQNTQSNKTSGSIARIIIGQEADTEITDRWFNVFSSLQPIYTKRRLQYLRLSIELHPERKNLQDENSLLRKLSNPQDNRNVTLKMLINDIFIIHKLKELLEKSPNTVTHPSILLDEEHSKLKAEKGYRKELEQRGKKKLDDQDVASTIKVFVRYQALAKYLYELHDLSINDWLETRKKGQEIQIREDFSSETGNK